MTAVPEGLDHRGFAASERLPSEVVGQLNDRFSQLDADQREYFSSSVHCDRHDASSIDRDLKSLIGQTVANMIGRPVEPFLGAFISKAAGFGSRVEYHQDWTYTDERRGRVIIAWVPLVDVGSYNGALSFVPGSHRWTDGIRSDNPHSPLAGLQRQLAQVAVLLPAEAGRVLIYDPATVHGSTPNVSSQARPVAALAFKPVGAQLVHFHQPAQGPVEGYAVTDRWYAAQPYRHRPEGFSPVEAWAPPVRPADFERHLPTSGSAREPQASAPRSVLTPTRPPPQTPVRTPVLRDNRADTALHRDGFVSMPLLARDEIDALTGWFRRVLGDLADGCTAQELPVEPPLHRAVQAELESTLGQIVLKTFTGYRPFLWNHHIVCPQNEGLKLQQDWMYVDERAGASTFAVVIALDDVSGHDGQLRVLRGSHVLDRSLRGTGLSAAWLDDESPFERQLESIPLTAGSCVILNSALVRSSYPNYGTKPRLFVSMRMRPPSEPLVHFRRHDAHTAHRLDVDEGFFRITATNGLSSEHHDLGVREVVHLDERALSIEALQQRLHQANRRGATRLPLWADRLRTRLAPHLGTFQKTRGL